MVYKQLSALNNLKPLYAKPHWQQLANHEELTQKRSNIYETTF